MSNTWTTKVATTGPLNLFRRSAFVPVGGVYEGHRENCNEDDSSIQDWKVDPSSRVTAIGRNDQLDGDRDARTTVSNTKEKGIALV